MVSRAESARVRTGAYAPLHKEARAVHSEVVYEGQECKRCGAKIRRKLVTNSDGTLSCVGWEPDTEETDNK
jgi:formamidopyrimidine-DNA glycosylase